MEINIYVDVVRGVDNIQLFQSCQLSQSGEVAPAAVVVDEQRTPARRLPAPAASASAATAAAAAAAATAPTATTAPHGNDNGRGAATRRVGAECRQSVAIIRSILSENATNSAATAAAIGSSVPLKTAGRRPSLPSSASLPPSVG